MKCPVCGENMHEIDAGLWTCQCGISFRLEVPEPEKQAAAQKAYVPTVCMLDCPERKRCDVKNNPKRCAVFRAVKVRGMRTIR